MKLYNTIRGGVRLPFLLILLLVFSLNTVSQVKKDFNFKHLSVQEGLSNNTIQCMYQDISGKVWIGTQDGLNCYNGYEVTTYLKTLGDSLTLPGNHIMDITEDVNQKLWIGTSKGLCFFDPKTKQFRPVPQFLGEMILGFLTTSKNELIVCTQMGIYRYDSNKDIFIENNFIKQIKGERKLSSKAFQLDTDMYLLVPGTQPIVYSLKNNEIQELPLAIKIKPSINNLTISSILKTNKNEYLLGSISQGLYRLSLKNGLWDIENIYNKYFKDNKVRALLKDSHDNIWIATYNGLYIIPESGEVQLIIPNSLNPYSISYQSITSLLETRDGSICVGTYFGGVNIFRQNNNQFRSYDPSLLFPNLKHKSVRGIARALNGDIWMGTQGSGIVIMNPDNHTFKQFEHAAFNNTNIHSLLMDNFGRMWIGTYLDGLFVYNFGNKKLTKVTLWNDNKLEISALDMDKNNNLYIGSMTSGLKILKLSKDGYSLAKNPQITQSLGKSISYLIVLQNNNVAVASEFGLRVYSPQTHIVSSEISNKNLEQNPAKIHFIHEDSKQNLWFGTQDKGIIIRKNDGSIISLNTNNGLANNWIYGIIEDNNNNHWVSTNQGISFVSDSFEVLKNYDVNDGLISNQFCFNASYRSTDNLLYFGSISGLSIINPSGLIADNIQLTPVINEIRVLNKNILNIDTKELHFKDREFESLTLKYEQRSFTINFLSYYFNGTRNLKYRFRLLNFNDDWRETNLRMADYTNIDAGDYTFQISVLNPNGSWSEPATVEIKILPVWYLSKFAFLIYFLLASSLVYLTIKLLRYRINLQNEVKLSKLEIEKTEEVNQMKLRFFTNISHEFRTPLTLISGPIENLIHLEKNKDKKLMLEIAKRNSNRLLLLVNNILDFRKAEQGNLQLNLTQKDLGTFIIDQSKVFAELADKKHINFAINISKSVGNFMIDAEKMETVMFNLLSNAFKFTGDSGTIAIDVETVKLGVNIHLSDNGIGIPESKQTKIFERFYQVEGNSQSEIKGSGIGLALVKEIIETHGGSISVSSIENKGTKFSIFLPGKSTAVSEYNNEDITSIKEHSSLFEMEELSETSGTIGGPSILIIDDNKDLLAFLSHALNEEYRIILAENGQQGLERVEKYNPDLIITDIMMPQMDGIEFCQTVKNRIETSHIPLIMLSARSTTPEQIEGLSTGADIYITKPFSTEFLKLQIKNILQLIKHRHAVVGTGKSMVEIKELKLSKRDQTFLNNLDDLIKQNIENNSLTNDFLAEKLFISTSTLYRKATALTGKGINDYIRFKRLIKSKELLKTEEYSISEIAYMTGFNTPSYFSKCFRKEFGMLPKEYVSS